MIRFLGTFLPPLKQIKFALPTLFGIGLSTSIKILKKTGINANVKCIELSPKQILLLRHYITKYYIISTVLKRNIEINIKTLVIMKCIRGKRHFLKLPVRGQRTRTNARTKRGPKQTVSVRKK